MTEAGQRIAEKSGARVLVAEAPVLRRCEDCGADITHRHKQATICRECGTLRQSLGGARSGEAAKISRPTPMHLETVDPCREPRTPREAMVQACMTANRKMWTRDRTALLEDADGSTAWTKQGLSATGETSPRKCLGCGEMFESLGPENRICGGCKNTSAYASSGEE